MSKPKIINREQWLTRLVQELEKTLFVGREMPPFRITCGFPSKGGTATAKRVIGQNFAPEASADETNEIIMTITIADEMKIAGVVAHEMVHAIIGNDKGHGKEFKALATEIGLEGKMTATTEGEAFKQTVQPILNKLGKYPHAELNAAVGKKTQGTRMIKMSCEECGYIARTSQKWIDEVGALHCPNHGEMEVDE